MKNSFEEAFSSFDDMEDYDDLEENSFEESDNVFFTEIEDDDIPEIPDLDE